VRTCVRVFTDSRKRGQRWMCVHSLQYQCARLQLRAPTSSPRCVFVYVCLCVCVVFFLRAVLAVCLCCYGVPSISRLLKITSLFCRIPSLLLGSFAIETYSFKEPTSRSHPTCTYVFVCLCPFWHVSVSVLVFVSACVSTKPDTISFTYAYMFVS